MGVKFEFMNSEKTGGKKFAAQIEDVLVFLLIWGEAANLRHMPECLCFLYHKIMKDHKASMDKTKGSYRENLYPGHFLDHVITPIYEVVAAALRGKVIKY